MHKIIILILAILLAAISLEAQINPAQKEIDKVTFDLFKAGKWDELIEKGENALSSDALDFFALRYRIGTAYYKTGDYQSAIIHLEKALRFAPTDVSTMEYLYYSYLFMGRESEWLSLVYDMPLNLKKKLEVYSKFIYGAYTEGGYTYNADYSDQKLLGLKSFPNLYNEKELQKGITYFDIGLMHQIGKNLKVFQCYNNISAFYTEQLLEKSMGQREYDTKTVQDEYYLDLNFNLGKAWNLVTALHYMYVRSEDVRLRYDSSVNPWIPNYDLVRTPENDFVALLALTKYIGHFRIGLKNSISNMNSATQVQNTAEIIFYPLGNLNLYTITNATVFSNKDWGRKFKSSGILDQMLGWKITDNLWMETGYTFGYIYNFNELDGFIVFNNNDRILNRFSVNLISPVSKHIQLSIRYQYYNQELATLFYTFPKEYSTIITNNSNHKIVGGLRWTF